MKTLKFITIIAISITMLNACKKDIIETNFIFKKIPLDTTKQTIVFTSQGPTINRNSFPKNLNLAFNPRSTCLFSYKMFVANQAGKRIDIFDVNKFLPIHTFTDSLDLANPNNATMEPTAVYADQELILVASNNPAASQIFAFHNNTYKYITRIGDGSPTGIIKYPMAVTANIQYVFVKDLTPEIKIFNRNDIVQNNSPQIIKTITVEDPNDPIDENFSMTVVGYDTLYTVNPLKQKISLYYIPEISENQNPLNTIYLQNFIPTALTADRDYLYIAGVEILTNQTFILLFDKNKFITGQTNKPLFKFYQTAALIYKPITDIKIYNDALIFNQNNEELDVARIKFSVIEKYTEK